MGPLGVQEMVFIFVLALLLFGPKKLPEIARTIGKAMAEFRRASNELKATFDREMKDLEHETNSFKEVTSQYQYDTSNYDYSSYDSSYDEPHTIEAQDSSAEGESPAGMSVAEGAPALPAALPEGAIAQETEPAAASPEHAAQASTAADRKAS